MHQVGTRVGGCTDPDGSVSAGTDPLSPLSSSPASHTSSHHTYSLELEHRPKNTGMPETWCFGDAEMIGTASRQQLHCFLHRLMLAVDQKQHSDILFTPSHTSSRKRTRSCLVFRCREMVVDGLGRSAVRIGFHAVAAIERTYEVPFPLSYARRHTLSRLRRRRSSPSSGGAKIATFVAPSMRHSASEHEIQSLPRPCPNTAHHTPHTFATQKTAFRQAPVLGEPLTSGIPSIP